MRYRWILETRTRGTGCQFSEPARAELREAIQSTMNDMRLTELTGFVYLWSHTEFTSDIEVTQSLPLILRSHREFTSDMWGHTKSLPLICEVIQRVYLWYVRSHKEFDFDMWDHIKSLPLICEVTRRNLPLICCLWGHTNRLPLWGHINKLPLTCYLCGHINRLPLIGYLWGHTKSLPLFCEVTLRVYLWSVRSHKELTSYIICKVTQSIYLLSVICEVTQTGYLCEVASTGYLLSVIYVVTITGYFWSVICEVTLEFTSDMWGHTKSLSLICEAT